jgi:hypothetical protein
MEFSLMKALLDQPSQRHCLNLQVHSLVPIAPLAKDFWVCEDDHLATE